MTETGLVPEPLHAFAAELERDADHQVTATQVAPKRWLLVCDTGTVRLEAAFQGYTRGRWRGATSNVWLNGEHVPRGELTYEGIVWLLRDPSTRGTEVPVLDVDTPTVPVTDLDAVPEKIQNLMRTTRQRVRSKRRALLAVDVENGRSRWVIVTTFADDLIVRRNLFVRRDPNTLQELVYQPADRPLEVFRGGRDVTDSTDPVVQGLLRILTFTGRVTTAAPGPTGVDAEAGAARSNSVEVRRATVIRT